MPLPLVGVLLFLLTGLFASGAQATVPPRPSSLATITKGLAAELAGVPPGSFVISAPLRSDEASPRGDELAVRLSALLSGSMSQTRHLAEPLSLSAARSAGKRAGSFVYVQAEIAHGELRVSADLYPVPRSFWQRLLRPNPPPSRHAFASGRIDAEVRSFLAPIPLVLGKVQKASTGERDLVALACGDVEADGGLELVTVSRRRIARGRLRQGKFAASHQASWRELSPVAPAPMREPLAGIALGSEEQRSRAPFIDVGLTDRAHGMRLDPSLQPIAPVSGLPIAFGARTICAQLQAGDDAPSLSACAPKDPAPELGPLSAPTDIVAAASIITKTGDALSIFATRNPHDGELRLVSKTAKTSLPGVGAQIAIADLDADGYPEVITASDVLLPAEDSLLVHSWEPGKAPVERARIPVPAGIVALAACPPDGPGSAKVALATAEGEIWVIQ